MGREYFLQWLHADLKSIVVLNHARTRTNKHKKPVSAHTPTQTSTGEARTNTHTHSLKQALKAGTHVHTQAQWR